MALSPASQRRALDLTRYFHLHVEYWPIMDPTGLGETREDKEEDKKGYHMRERRYGSFERRFALPEDVDRDRLDAKVANGVLTVTMPRRADADKPRSIEVKG